MMKKRALAGIVIALCSWVLWEKVESTIVAYKHGKVDRWKNNEQWKFIGAYKNIDECRLLAIRNSDLRAKTYSAGKGVENVDKNPTSVNVTFKDNGGFVIHSFKCSPDTIDPRPKK